MPPQIQRFNRQQLSDLKRRLWLPTGAIDETLPRELAGSQVTIVSGTLRLSGRLVLPAGVPVTTASFFSGTTPGSAMTNQWFSLVRLSDLSVLAKTIDDTSTAWGASALKTLSFATGTGIYTPAVDTAVYLGALVVGTPPTLMGATTQTNAAAAAPVLSGNSTAALTNPASLGATAGAITASGVGSYGYVS